MLKTLIVARRELANYVFSPMAYVVGAVFLAVSSILFFYGFPQLRVEAVFVVGGEPSLRQLFVDLAWVMVFVAPLLTMRLLSDEYGTGTIEKLLTAPISESAIIMGKFLAVLAFYAMLLATSLVYLALLAQYAKPDPGVVVMGYLGMLLLGASFLSVGLFTSCLTRHQLLAAVLGVVILGTFTLVMQGLTALGATGLEDFPTYELNTMTQLLRFAQGTFDTRGLVYFLTGSAVFLFFSVKALESRRWR